MKARGIDPVIAERCGVREENGAIVWPTLDPDGKPSPRRRSLNGAGPKVRGAAGGKLAAWWPMGRPGSVDAVLICEGESDALAALTAFATSDADDRGPAFAVTSVPGTGFPRERLAAELRDVGASEAILAYDGDMAGRKAAERVADALAGAGINARALSLADGEDLASTLADEPDPGPWLSDAIRTAQRAETAPPTADGSGADGSLEQRLTDARVDLLALLDGGLPERAWLPSSERMLARGSRHHVAAPLKSGKSLGFLAHAVDMTTAGARVVILDRENGDQEYARRLHDILTDRPASARDAVRDRLAYYAWPTLKLTDGPELGGAFAGVDLVILDSTRTFLSSLALDENASDDFAKFSTAIVEPLFRAGIATLQLDNAGHGDTNRARGSSSKGDLADVLYTLKTTAAFDQQRRGRLKLTRSHSRFGDIAPAFTMDIGGGHFGTFTADQDASDQANAAFRPTVLMRRVADALDEQPGLSKRAIRETTRGSTEAKELAIELLVIEGYVRVERDGRAVRHYLDKPFNEPETSTVPDRAGPCRGTDGADRATVPPPLRGHGLSLIHISEPTRPY